MMVNQKARIGMTMAIAMITAMTTNKPNARSIHLEPDSQLNPSISALAAYTECTSPSLGHKTSIDSAKPLSSYIDKLVSSFLTRTEKKPGDILQSSTPSPPRTVSTPTVLDPRSLRKRTRLACATTTTRQTRLLN
jgi:hypothetical protein